MLSFNFKGKKFNLVQKYWVFVIVSAVIILAGLIDMFFVRHMNYGVEFSGGMRVTVEYETETAGEKNIKDEISKYFKDAGYEVDGEPQNEGSAGHNAFSYRIKTQVSGEEGVTVKAELEKLLEDFGEVEVSASAISQDAKNRLVRSAVIAVIVAVIVILAYIAIRFNLLAGVAAIIALLHDVLIMFALTTLFQIPVNTTFIAAVITILGYSINATIVIFDRVRENVALPSNIDKTDAEIAEESIMSTMSRSILTTLTTFVMILCLAIFTNSSIRDFAFPIIFGLIAGLYSSILLSASTWVQLRKLFKLENKKPVKKIKKIKEQANV